MCLLHTSAKPLPPSLYFVSSSPHSLHPFRLTPSPLLFFLPLSLFRSLYFFFFSIVRCFTELVLFSSKEASFQHSLYLFPTCSARAVLRFPVLSLFFSSSFSLITAAATRFIPPALFRIKPLGTHSRHLSRRPHCLNTPLFVCVCVCARLRVCQ